MPNRRFEINQYGEIIEETEQRNRGVVRDEEESGNWTFGPLSVLYYLVKDALDLRQNTGILERLALLLEAILLAPLFLPFALFIGLIVACCVCVGVAILYLILWSILIQFGIDISVFWL